MGKLDFIDEVKIFVRAGNGGSGSRHFRRERYIPKGGPDGGNGGHGGSIILVGDSNLRTLLDFRYRKHLVAADGQPGTANRCTGARGEDLILPVPIGTVIQEENGNTLGEIVRNQQKHTVASGGKGGLGNVHFKSSTNQSPHYAQSGKQGEQRTLRLELKVLGDVSLVGYPNAGKSTLLSVLSAAKPKIGDYPFTTLVPKAGVVFYQKSKSFVMIDIPGIIQGASQGKGLGLRFLRHIERGKMLLFVIPADQHNLYETYCTLQNELKSYDPRLLDKEQLLLISKIDLINQEDLTQMKAALPRDVQHICVSAQQEKGLKDLKRLLWYHIQTIRQHTTG